ncbi:general secretion pathway protein GspE [Aggregicoccus sp. 17bor-14]|uniref:GspE/PulE/PilB domain-containing protein n=1 Tax=Myxococcaceae TaxID=31 RepID=UPI00129C6F02|nr:MULTISPECIES: general secretion pathway protein GspE [Myxococcaceae]MBF5044218.1 general secretion pathway protein GspE [Simulacricoccus sp. 17bor-14]MRI89968.1 general secretion pathway protein GspE [Aggregicoccus sp. 17bor-14]
MRLGELLLAERLLTAEALEEGLEAQVVQGGRLGTNLVEMGLLSEQNLARCLGRQHNMPFASGEMVPDPKALSLVDLDHADDKDYLPMRLDGTRLSVAITNPHDVATLDELAFRTGKRVVPVLIPEFRMNQLQRRYCRSFRPIRAIDLETARPARPAAPTAAPQARGDGRLAPSTGDLMGEDEFQALYAQALEGGAAPATAPAPEAPAPRAAPVPPPAPVEPAQPAAAAPLPLTMPAPPPAPVPPSPPRTLTPLTFAQAQAELARSSDREDVAATVLRFALGKWKRSLLLSVQGDLVTGWHGLGQGVRDAAVRRIGIALRNPSTFKLVRDTRSHFVGPVRADAAAAVFYKLLGAGAPTTAVMLPLLVRGKVVHILYVDDGPDQLTTPDVGELLILSQSVGRSYEAMIRKRKGG